jgi:hypothetical protein
VLREGRMDTELKKVEITREALIEKMIEHRGDDWDHHDTDEVLRHGRYGFVEMSNEELEEIASESYYIPDENGIEVKWKISDADTSLPNRYDALKGLYEYCLHEVPNMSEYGDGAAVMKAARLAIER